MPGERWSSNGRFRSSFHTAPFEPRRDGARLSGDDRALVFPAYNGPTQTLGVPGLCATAYSLKGLGSLYEVRAIQYWGGPFADDAGGGS